MKHNIEAEIWKDVVGYEGIYSISSYGRVRRELLRTTGKPGHILKPFLSKQGYLRVQLTMNGERRKWFVARLVARAFCAGFAEKLQVNHIDANPLNNHYSNLEWVTHTENQRHARSMGLFKGYTVPKKLSTEDVKMIRFLASTKNVTHRFLANSFGVVQSTITRIVNNKRRTKGVYIA